MKAILSTILLVAFAIQGTIAQNQIDPKKTEDWSRKPEIVSPGKKAQAPSDAIILFDKGSLDAWESTGKDASAKWKVKGKSFQVAPGSGSISTKQKFGDCQLHIEWKTPIKDVREGKKDQKCGNSGIFFMERYELQVLNSYENETYYNGMASSIYKQHIPLVNATLKPGKWQVYDIIFTAPRFNHDRTLNRPGYITVLLNGVLVQNHVELKGPTEFRGVPIYKFHEEKLPIMLQDHSNEVSYRNVWIREL